MRCSLAVRDVKLRGAAETRARSNPHAHLIPLGQGWSSVWCGCSALVSCTPNQKSGPLIPSLSQRSMQIGGFGVLTAKSASASAHDLHDHRPCPPKTAVTSTAARRRPPNDHRPRPVEGWLFLACFGYFSSIRVEKCAWRRKCRE